MTTLAVKNYNERKKYELLRAHDQVKKIQSEKLSTSFNIGYGLNNSADELNSLLDKPQNRQSINFFNSKDIVVSMDGKGRATDNAFIERLWRTVKQEYVYLNPEKDTRSSVRIYSVI